MIHRPGIEVASVVSLASSNGLRSFLRETAHSVAVVANGLRVCGVKRSRADALSVLPNFAVWSRVCPDSGQRRSPLGPKTDPRPSCSDSTHTGQHHAFSLFLALCAGTSMSTTNLNTPTSYKNALKSNVTLLHSQASKRVLIYCSAGWADLSTKYVRRSRRRKGSG